MIQYMNRTVKSSRVTLCVVCEVPLDYFSNNRRIPDYLCSTHWGMYQDQLDAPWLKYLMNQERYRRMKRQRRIQAGIIVEEISLNQLAEAGFTIPQSSVKDPYDSRAK